MTPAALSDLQDASDDDHWPLLKSGQFRPGSIAGNTAGELAWSGNETKRNPRWRFGLVSSPGRVAQAVIRYGDGGSTGRKHDP